jgi:hypothetical protein
MKVFCLFMVLFWSLGMMFFPKETQSDISKIQTSQFTWHTEESFHAHESTFNLNSASNFGEGEEDDEVNDEDENNSKCFFSKKDIQFTFIHLKESLISKDRKFRLSKPFLKPQFTPPDAKLIA